MNFVSVYKQGQQGRNKGIPTGIPPLNKALNGIQRGSIYGIAAAPKAGKTTLCDQAFLLEPYLYSLEHNVDIEWIYFSYEIDRIKKEFKLVPYFFKKFYDLEHFEHEGKQYRISSNYLLGKLEDKDGNIIKVRPEHEEVLKQVYARFIVPLFGEYDAVGKQIRKGAVDFYEHRDNATGIYKMLLDHAERNGEFLYKTFTMKEDGKMVTKKVINGYKPKNPDKYTIVVLDHLRKLKTERGFSEKQNIDKMLEFQVILRNFCKYVFVDIIHLNRSISDVDRIKFAKEFLYPTGDDVKGSGNLSEEADYLITLFNPRDEKYNLTKHFGVDIKNYPNYRSIHLVESRDTECPVHIGTIMDAESNIFKRLNQ